MAQGPADVVTIPRWTDDPDYFVWDAFDWASQDPARHLEPEATQQQALLAETHDLYAVPDQFGVVSGHLLVIPKKPASSIAGLDAAVDDQINWFVDHVSHLVATEYDAQVVIAEHGECGCTTADQAHIHVLPVPRTLTPARLRTIMDDVLQRRMVGIERITYRGAEFTALEDLQALIQADAAVVSGRQLRCADFTNDGAYPAAARTASGLIRPYVYFRGPGVRFVSTCSFRSQFAREIVSIAMDQPEGRWDRRVYPNRANMFATFTRLAPAFWHAEDTRHGYRARAGKG